MGFMQQVAAMDASLVLAFGEPVTYYPVGPAGSKPTHAIIDHDIQFYTEYTDIISGGVVITLLSADVPDPKHDDRIRDATGKFWKVLRKLESDGSIVTVNAAVDYTGFTDDSYAPLHHVVNVDMPEQL
ncbi:hypothetical protein GCM10023116_46730 [Kistimonas scapharcae]|uniref:DUF3168 domain-containing protein n=2 Tax=Kistimonas scapharcae TaxID=1036133 RepID=A0ABP8V8U5_9GAMM